MQIRKNIEKIIEQLDAKGIEDLGKVIRLAKEQMQLTADGKTISDIAKELLNNM